MKPPIREQLRDIICTEYATPPMISGKRWEERVLDATCQLFDQAKAEVAREFQSKISKLKPLSDEEIKRTQGKMPSTAATMSGEDLFYFALSLVAQAQLDAVKKELEGK